MKLPKVHVIGTGGSIAMLGRHRQDLLEYGTSGNSLTIQELLARIPEIKDVAEVSAEQAFLEDYQTLTMSPHQWLTLAQRCNALFSRDADLSGIVITHGTNLAEEAAYFLTLTVADRRPIVVTGAQRPPTALSSDADGNLIDAIRIAGATEAQGKGVLVAFNGEINSARDVTKSNTYRLEAFQSPHLGFLGYADNDGKAVFYRTPIRKHTFDSEFDITNIRTLPLVDIVYVYGALMAA